jgi:hypothetical protein
MNHPIKKAILGLPKPPYYSANKDFRWDEEPHDFPGGTRAGGVSIGPDEAATRLRELADYIEKNAKEGKEPEPDSRY